MKDLNEAIFLYALHVVECLGVDPDHPIHSQLGDVHIRMGGGVRCQNPLTQNGHVHSLRKIMIRLKN